MSSVSFVSDNKSAPGRLPAIPLVLGIFRVTFFSFGTRAAQAKAQP